MMYKFAKMNKLGEDGQISTCTTLCGAVVSTPSYAAVSAGGGEWVAGAGETVFRVSPPLPGGVCGMALMTNGGKPRPGFEGLFRCVEQTDTAGR